MLPKILESLIMEVIIVLIVLFTFFFFFLKKRGTNSRNHYSPQEDYPLEVLSPNESHEKWIAQYEQNLKEESELLNGGYYDQFRCLKFEIAGIHYRTGLAKETILGLDLLSEIHLIKEPTNEYDRYAVKIVHDRKRLGYVPCYDSQQVTKLINENQIKKILVINSGKDFTSSFSDALSVEVRIYYEPTPAELAAEERARIRAEQEEKEKQEYKARKMLEPVIYPSWMMELMELINATKVESDSQKWELKKLKDNIRNSIKSYEKAIREEKELIADNASKRLQQYKEELEKLLCQE